DSKENEEKDKEEAKEGKSEKAPFTFKLRHAIVSIGTVFVLALIAYTTILYGGKLFVDQDKLLITPPTTIETEEGEILWYLYDEFRFTFDLEYISDYVKDAIVTMEDKNFYSHSGVDMHFIFRALYKYFIARDKVEGAITITQQLAKNLFLSNDKSWL